MTARYQRIAITLYISVIVAIIVYISLNQLNQAPAGPPRRGPRPIAPLPMWVPILGNVSITAFLVFLESRLTNKSLPDLPRVEASIHLGLRFLLVSLMIVIGQAPFAVYMLFPVLLFTFFTFGQKIAYGFAVVSSLFVMSFVFALSPSPIISSPDMNNLLVYILGVLIVLLLANVLLQEHETNKQLQQANGRLEESHAQLQEYSTQVATLAATDERNRLARDIHDSLGHHLMASSIQLEKAKVFLDRDVNQSADALDHAQRTIREALTEVRTSVKALREQKGSFDLIPELNDLIERMSHHDLTINFNLSGDSTLYSTFVKMTIYRIIQEGLTNIHKHADATQADIDLTFTEQQATLNITDNGNGFDPATRSNGTQAINGKYGLKGIQERVALVGGRYAINSELQKGTVLSITTPRTNGMAE